MQPLHFDALHMMGVVSIQTSRLDRAIKLIRTALKQNSRVAAAHRNLALALKNMGRIEEALVNYRQAIALQPDYADTYIHLASALTDLRRPEVALPHCDRAIVLRPQDPFAHLAKAVAFRSMQRPEDALASCDAAIAAQSNCAEAWDKRGAALQDLGRPEEALLSCEKAIALRSDFALAYVHAGLICLQMGHFERGWQLSEWRERPSTPATARNPASPRWCGDADLNGMRLLVNSEQGLGDTIQFCRFAKLLVAQGAHVIPAVQPGLRALLQSLGPGVQVIADSDAPPEFDRHCPLMSLPLAFRTTAQNIPVAVPYLLSESQRVLRWRERLGRRGFKIGISWQGSTLPAAVGRSFPLRMLHSISNMQGARLISLQKGYGTEQLGGLPDGMNVEDLGADFDGRANAFLDTAAVMESLDLIITCDTSIAHLAGALGRPTWIALKHAPDWRWMLDREDSPWYPSVRLFRQKNRGHWEDAFDPMLQELQGIVPKFQRSDC
jgi:Tfp pilus assembly protein PilF